MLETTDTLKNVKSTIAKTCRAVKGDMVAIIVGIGIFKNFTEIYLGTPVLNISRNFQFHY